MDIRGLFFIFALSHILGDFYFQTKKLAKRKDEEFPQLLLHAGIYALTMFALAAVFLSIQIMILAAALALVHFIIDIIKMFVVKVLTTKRLNERKDIAAKYGIIYTVDQTLHLIIIYISCATFFKLGWTFEMHEWAIKTVSFLGVDYKPAAKIIFTLLMLLKPVNITLSKIFSIYKPIRDEIENFEGAGSWIGNLERMLIVLLLSIGQYAAIGLAITAKSIVRYPQIKDSKSGAEGKAGEKAMTGKEFGEYYLIGTLFSFISAIVIYNLIW